MKYYINMDGQTYGPFSFINITQMPILEDTLICTDGEDGGWKEAREYTEFLHLFQNSETAVSVPEKEEPHKPDDSVEVTPPPLPPVDSEEPVLPPWISIDVNGQIVKNKLPTRRGYKMTVFLTIITCGIYGLILPFIMGKDTNISCCEDGKHTSGFWKALLLSVITFGIYGLIWKVEWCNREANFLQKHHAAPLLTGGSYFVMTVLFIALIAGGSFLTASAVIPQPETEETQVASKNETVKDGQKKAETEVRKSEPVIQIETVNYNLLGSGVALLVFGIITFLMIIGRMNIQHNLVNKAFNVEKFLEESE